MTLDSDSVTALITGHIDLTKFTVIRRSLVTGRTLPMSGSIFNSYASEKERVEAENFVLEVIPRG